jgi:hypothetical protein
VLPIYTIPEWGRWAASLNPQLAVFRTAASAYLGYAPMVSESRN